MSHDAEIVPGSYWNTVKQLYRVYIKEQDE